MTYKISSAIVDNIETTLLAETTQLKVPWVIAEYCNKTTLASHEQILANLKMVLEEGLHKQWSEKDES